eukprot:PhM_4_TR3443/c0_g1_i1/m.35225
MGCTCSISTSANTIPVSDGHHGTNATSHDIATTTTTSTAFGGGGVSPQQQRRRKIRAERNSQRLIEVLRQRQSSLDLSDSNNNNNATTTLLGNHMVALRDADEEVECSICLMDMRLGGTQDTAAIVLPCGHVFHEKCIGSWFERNPTCPYCCQDVRQGAVAAAAASSATTSSGGSGGQVLGFLADTPSPTTATTESSGGAQVPETALVAT